MKGHAYILVIPNRWKCFQWASSQTAMFDLQDRRIILWASSLREWAEWKRDYRERQAELDVGPMAKRCFGGWAYGE